MTWRNKGAWDTCPRVCRVQPGLPCERSYPSTETFLFEAPPQRGDASRWSALFAAEFPEAKYRVWRGRRLRPGIRVLTGDDDWHQALDLHFACYGPPSSSDGRHFVERQVAGHRRLCETGHGSWSGAFVEGRLCAGAGLFADGSGLARYQNVATHPDFRRRGLASAVIHHAAQRALLGRAVSALTSGLGRGSPGRGGLEAVGLGTGLNQSAAEGIHGWRSCAGNRLRRVERPPSRPTRRLGRRTRRPPTAHRSGRLAGTRN
ncbi:GNAT family N-acetyltransferase [Streptomyces sp. NPDC001480]|uniref:GNAT family N-acetyltransferase n=1 Tax=Streptomyces sp. NPDC001480 TaxID=3364577 RepID=UPI0036C42E6D